MCLVTPPPPSDLSDGFTNAEQSELAELTVPERSELAEPNASEQSELMEGTAPGRSALAVLERGHGANPVEEPAEGHGGGGSWDYC